MADGLTTVRCVDRAAHINQPWIGKELDPLRLEGPTGHGSLVEASSTATLPANDRQTSGRSRVYGRDPQDIAS